MPEPSRFVNWVAELIEQLDKMEELASSVYGHCLNCPAPQSEEDVTALLSLRASVFKLSPGPADATVRLTAAQAAHENRVLAGVSGLSGGFATLLDNLERALQTLADAGRCGLLSRACFQPNELSFLGGQFVCRVAPGFAGLPPDHPLRRVLDEKHIPYNGVIPVCPAKDLNVLGVPPRKVMPNWFRAEPIRAKCEALANESRQHEQDVEERRRVEDAAYQAEIVRRRRLALQAELDQLAKEEVAGHA